MVRLAAALALLVPALSLAQGDAGVLTLDEAVRTALESHPSIRRARADVAGAEAGVGAARAPLFPQVQGQASWQFQDRPSVQLGTSFVRSSGQSAAAGLSVNQLVTDFGRTTNGLRAAAATEDAQREGELDVRDSVVANVRQAFFTARARKALLAVAEQNLANQQRHLEQVAAFVELGERPPYDLAQAQTNAGAARSQLAAARGEYRVARASLVQAMGIPIAADFEVADQGLPPIEGEGGSAEDLLPEALGARHDVAALEQRIRSSEYFVRSNRAGWFPTLGITGGIDALGPAFDDLDGPAWKAGVTLTWQLFQGGATLAAVRQAEASVDGLRAERDALAQQVRFELEQSLAAIQSALAAREAADETLASAREQLRLAEGRYETGLGSLLELADAELALQQAEGARVQAEYDLSAARALLLRRLGRG
ncbi:MAG TPA: TolC family protein [Vulgatibacter sp.]|nr:TolC family protein [Vulgatibacter sp.]